ncbi:hypothetical protein GBA52_027906 [Prunus armeniaca]|nr:hypothetical protein GBA52_027906 [Prunus armeniaca]
MRHQSTKNFIQITSLLIPFSFLDNLLHNPTIFAQQHWTAQQSHPHKQHHSPAQQAIDHAMVQTLHHSTLTELGGFVAIAALEKLLLEARATELSLFADFERWR